MKNKNHGYNICNVTNKTMKKEDSIKELEKIETNIKAEIINILENKGYVYGLMDKDTLKAVYLFENTKSENKNILVFKTSLCTDDVKDKIEQFEKIVLEELKEIVNFGICSKVIWNDIEIEPNTINGFSGFNFSICIFLGILYGIIFDNIAVGLPLGVAIGLCFGAVVKKKK